MEFRQLRYFIKIVELGSFSRAARDLRVAQPALSYQISILETELKTLLLTRDTRGVHPTEIGASFYRTAVSIVRELERLRNDVKVRSENPSGRVSIGLPTTTARVLALPLLIEMRALYPRIQLQVTEIVSSLLKELVVHGRLDMAILLDEAPSKTFISRPLVIESLFVAFSPNGYRGKIRHPEVRLQDLASETFILPSKFVPLRNRIEAALADFGLELNVIAEIDSVQSLIASVEAGLGSTILPWSALHNEAREGKVLISRIVDPPISWKISLCALNTMQNNFAAPILFETVQKVVATLIKNQTWKGATEVISEKLEA